MARMPKPWFRESTGTYYVQIAGRQHSLGKDKKAAFAKYHQLMGHGSGPDHAYTVQDVLDAYWNWFSNNRAAETCKTRKRLLRSFGASVGQTLKASDIKPFHVQAWIDSNSRKKVRTKGGVRITDEKISPTTINTRITAIIGVFTWAEGMGYIPRNPLGKMPKPECEIRQEYLPANTWPHVLELARDQEFKDWLTVMLYSGSRAQEMFKFKAEHIDGNRLTLPIKSSKGKKKSRVVYLPNDVLPIVQKYAKQNPEGALFRRPDGKPWNRNAIRCRFRRLKRELKMPGLCATTLRHSFAHHRLTAGQDSLTVSKLMGHADTRMIATRYGHLEANVDYMTQAANFTPGQSV